MRHVFMTSIVVLASMTTVRGSTQVQGGVAAGTPGGTGSTSALLQPALGTVRSAMSSVRLEKWKLTGDLRGEMEGNLRSIGQDFDQTLPPLLITADAAPASVGAVLPVSRNIDAVYDVALRVAATAKTSAPAAQSAMLEDAMSSLQEARRQLDGRIQSLAEVQEKRVSDLQANVKTLQDTAAARSAAEAQMPAPVVRKPKPKVKTKPAPTAQP